MGAESLKTALNVTISLYESCKIFYVLVALIVLGNSISCRSRAAIAILILCFNWLKVIKRNTSTLPMAVRAKMFCTCCLEQRVHN